MKLISLSSSLLLVFSIGNVSGFSTVLHHHRGSSTPSSTTALDMSKIGLFFGTSTGSTADVADMIVEEFSANDIEIDGPFDVDGEPVLEMFAKYDSLIVGTPTWNTGADVERSGTGWDEIYYGGISELQGALAGKKVAVFGLGDQISYSENYADATGELHDVFENCGCTMIGYTSQDGYEHENSKTIRGDKFCGLLCDAVNQEDMTEERVQNWVQQLQAEGILEGSASTGAPAPAAAAVIDVTPAAAAPAPTVQVIDTPINGDHDAISKLERENAELRKLLEENSKLLDQSIASHDNNGYVPHLNPSTGKTMWISPDGRTCYYTDAAGGSTTTKSMTTVQP